MLLMAAGNWVQSIYCPATTNASYPIPAAVDQEEEDNVIRYIHRLDDYS
jgi:hypothetical protein